MTVQRKRDNVITLKQALEAAERQRYALGSFSPRYTPMIEPILLAGQEASAPLIVQISEKEMVRYEITPEEFAGTFYTRMEQLGITVPVVLHLDHTKTMSTIEAAIASGFTSVMIDASEKPLAENIAITQKVVRYAHDGGVSVEAELGMIGTTDFIETDRDEELYTDPREAKRFAEETGVDALAVSCGTAHGSYVVRQPKIDFERLKDIRALTPVHLVLHGGSGVPPEMVGEAIRLPGGGVSKVNIATDLELSLLQALGREERMTNKECLALSEDQLEKGRQAVKATVLDKMNAYLGSAGQAVGAGKAR